jgi:D-arabinose 1-dehydrogenase-like Zn-dependent alcohol dehydrogenase
MKAAVVREFGKPLAIEEVEVPRPGTGQVLVGIHACGVCHIVNDVFARMSRGAIEGRVVLDMAV